MTTKKYFGTDGVRGQANQVPMDSDTVLALARSFAMLSKPKRVVIAKDTRLSGYMLESALASGFSSMGVDVMLCGPVPTPGVAFLTRSMRADAGVMISASHNSFEDNGIKFFDPEGFKFPDEFELEIEANLEKASELEARALPAELGKARRIEDAIGRYGVFLKSCLKKQTKLDGLRVVIDASNGAAYRVAPMVFSELGAEVILTGAEPDGLNINDKVGSLYPENIQSLVLTNKADLGLSYDGDADRLIMCDDKGQLIDGDLILAVLAKHFSDSGELRGEGVVGTVMSNLGLEKALNSQGIKLLRAQVGDRYVLQMMKENGLVLGGEQSGHIISLEHNSTGDGVLSSLLMSQVLVESGKPASAWQKTVEAYPQKLINLKVKEKKPFEEIAGLADLVKASEERLADTGRLLLRYSGTEKKARVMVEAESDATCEAVAQEIADFLIRKIGV